MIPLLIIALLEGVCLFVMTKHCNRLQKELKTYIVSDLDNNMKGDT